MICKFKIMSPVLILTPYPRPLCTLFLAFPCWLAVALWSCWCNVLLVGNNLPNHPFTWHSHMVQFVAFGRRWLLIGGRPHLVCQGSFHRNPTEFYAFVSFLMQPSSFIQAWLELKKCFNLEAQDRQSKGCKEKRGNVGTKWRYCRDAILNRKFRMIF